MSLSTADILDIEYLKQNNIAKVLEEALAVLYEEKPKRPIDFFAKWLLNNCVKLDNEQKFKENINVKKDLKQQHQEHLQKLENERKEKQKKIDEENQIENSFKEKIQNEQYHIELLASEFPNYLEKRKNLTGVYIGIKDFPFKQINDEDEDEKSHLDIKKEKLIKYIAFSDSHKGLMQGKTISAKPEESITAGVFKDKKVNNEEENQQQQQQQQNQPQVNYVYVPELDKELRIQYFRLPKLGAFIAFPMKFFSYLKEEFFNDFLQKKQLYLASVEKWEEDKKLKEQEFLAEIEKLKDQPDLQKEKENEMQNFLNDYPQPPQEPEPLCELREYVVCADTMGQDRALSQEDIQYLEQYVNLFGNSWEEMERKVLIHDVDLQIEYLKNLPENIYETYDNAELAAEEEVKPEIEGLKETKEKEYQYLLDCARLEKLRQLICEDEELKKHIYYLKQFRTLKYPKVLQNILYFLGYKREQINQEDTHILDWKRSKELINEEDFFSKIREYTHKGQKTQAVELYSLINRVQSKLEKFNLQEIEDYNIGYGKVYKWVLECCKLRKLDIETRRINIADNHQEIDKKKQELEVWNNELNNKLQETITAVNANLQAALQPDENGNVVEVEPFNEDEWKNKWEEENPRPVVPERLQTEEDIDYEF